MANLLLVDDSAVQRGRIRRILQAQGHTVKEAGNGREALTLLESLVPDCILLDLMMPEMGGLELLRKQRERGPVPPVIILHTTLPESTRQACRQEGAVDFLLKPFEETEVLTVVRDVLAGEAISPGER